MLYIVDYRLKYTCGNGISSILKFVRCFVQLRILRVCVVIGDARAKLKSAVVCGGCVSVYMCGCVDLMLKEMITRV